MPITFPPGRATCSDFNTDSALTPSSTRSYPESSVSNACVR